MSEWRRVKAPPVDPVVTLAMTGCYAAATRSDFLCSQMEPVCKCGSSAWVLVCWMSLEHVAAVNSSQIWRLLSLSLSLFLFSFPSLALIDFFPLQPWGKMLTLKVTVCECVLIFCCITCLSIKSIQFIFLHQFIIKYVVTLTFLSFQIVFLYSAVTGTTRGVKSIFLIHS